MWNLWRAYPGEIPIVWILPQRTSLPYVPFSNVIEIRAMFYHATDFVYAMYRYVSNMWTQEN